MATSERHDRAFWEKIIDDFEASGEEHASFARRQGVSVGTFRHWLYRLRRERHGQSPRAAVRLLPVTVAASSLSEPVEVGVGGLVIRFRAGTDADYVAGLVAALRERA